MQHSIKVLLKGLWPHIAPRRRIQFLGLLFLMIFASFAEMVSIGAVIPFLAVLTSPERVFEHQYAQPMIHVLGILEPEQLLLPLTIAFGFATIIAGGMRLMLLKSSTRLSFSTGSDLSIRIYRRTLYQPYAVHVARNSSEIINGISQKSNAVAYTTIFPILSLVSSSVMLIAILAALFSLDPIIALVAFGGFGVLYVSVTYTTRARKILNSQHIARESTQVIKSLQEGLGGIRDVLIDGTQEAFCQIYRNADLQLRRAQGDNQYISQAPRYIMEALGMILIAVLAYVLAQQPSGIVSAIPILGALALGAQRLLPVMQQAYVAWSSMQGGLASLQDTLNLLNQPLPEHADQISVRPLPFLSHIKLRQVSFRYSQQTPWVLKNLDLTITKGSRVGFIGATGSGKSTLIDVLMGLLQVTEGSLRIDGQVISPTNNSAWQAHVAHVPQVIFLADSTIEENIAFGVHKDQIDSLRVRKAAQQAQISEAIESWPKQYQTFVGERGIRLSGGQRQRIGIARALYKQADVIIFDEATSALDNETEQAVMQAIEGLSKDLTLLIIAHRLTTLKKCTQIVELANNRVLREGSYNDIIASKN